MNLKEEINKIAYDIGWDYAVYYSCIPDYIDRYRDIVLSGFNDAKRRVNRKPHDRYIQKYLQLRYSALCRKRAVANHISPDLLRMLDNGWCPVTGQPLTYSTLQDTDWSVDRINNNGCYAAGNICIMSTRANKAKGTKDLAQITEIVNSTSDNDEIIEGLTRSEWKRLRWLTSKCSIDQLEKPVPFVTQPPIFVGINAYDLIQFFLVVGAVMDDKPVIASLKKNMKSMPQVIKFFRHINKVSLNCDIPAMVNFHYNNEATYDKFLVLMDKLGQSELKIFIKTLRDSVIKKGQAQCEENLNITENWQMDTRGYLSYDSNPNADAIDAHVTSHVKHELERTAKLERFLLENPQIGYNSNLSMSDLRKAHQAYSSK